MASGVIAPDGWTGDIPGYALIGNLGDLPSVVRLVSCVRCPTGYQITTHDPTGVRADRTDADVRREMRKNGWVVVKNAAYCSPECAQSYSI